MRQFAFVICILVGCLQVHGQVASICRPNERFLSCGGCQPTCLDPVPVCTAVCREGCYCPQDLVRNETGHCIPLSDCPPSANSTYQDETDEPRSKDLFCPDNEEYRFCEPCNKTCDNPNPICPAQCARGCFCKGELVRDRDGKCVMLEQCSNNDEDAATTAKVDTDQLRPKDIFCPENEEYRLCEPCNKTCDNPNPICPAQCARGCFCKGELVRDRDGKCVLLKQCSKNDEANYVKRNTDNLQMNCGPNQEFKDCENCEKTCSNPNPVCPAQCNRGCFCKDGFVKSPSGECVTLEKCPIDKCADENEEYSCLYPCQEFCSGRPCAVRAARCSLGCHCRAGLLREDTTGKCVKPTNCTTKNKKSVYH